MPLGTLRFEQVVFNLWCWLQVRTVLFLSTLQRERRIIVIIGKKIQASWYNAVEWSHRIHPTSFSLGYLQLADTFVLDRSLCVRSDKRTAKTRLSGVTIPRRHLAWPKKCSFSVLNTLVILRLKKQIETFVTKGHASHRR
jgi:hypothetical protein